MSLNWLDLIAEGDLHPRRFDNTDTLRQYLLKMERLTDEAAEVLLSEGRIAPPLTRRAYLVRPVKAQTY